MRGGRSGVERSGSTLHQYLSIYMCALLKRVVVCCSNGRLDQYLCEIRSAMASDQSPGEGTPIPTTEVDGEGGGGRAESSVTDEQWTAMQTVLDTVYDFRTEDGHDPSKVFHRKVNKRVLPDYYQVITEPVALSTIKAKINQKTYIDFAEFVRDFALVHNPCWLVKSCRLISSRSYTMRKYTTVRTPAHIKMRLRLRDW